MTHQRRSAHMAVPISETEAVSPPAQPGAPDLARPPHLAPSPPPPPLAAAAAGDIAPEAWRPAARALHASHGACDGFRGWAATIARPRALDPLRRRSRRPPPIPVPAEDLAGLAAADDTAARALDAVATRAAIALIATLPPDQAEAVLL